VVYHQPNPMNIGIIVNPKSGRNKASRFAKECERLLIDQGHTSHTINTQHLDTNDQLWDADRLVIIGGDGTVHHTLPKLIEHQIPFYHLATGTSNLIATEFNMPKDPASAVKWIEQGGQTNFDVPTLDSVPFLVMCSFGMDAGVIHRFQQLRTRSGGFRNYIRPVINEILHPRPAHIAIAADGNDLAIKSPMNLVVANMRSYALGINPCPNADPTDTKLDLLAVRCSTTLSWTLQTIRNRFRFQIPQAQRLQATTLTITGTSKPTVVQLDGEVANSPNLPNGILSPQPPSQSITIQIGQHQVPIITAPA